jgi:PAS domain S-box-containing protein
MKGYRSNEIIGQSFSRFYPAEDQDEGEPQRALETAVREGRYEQEGWRVRKDGSRFWAHVIIDTIHDEKGTLLGFAKVTRDVTERRNAEDAHRRMREALIQSQKMDALGQLTSGIAHDFNTLLMAILGNIELARNRRPADPRITPLLNNALLGAQRGAALAKRMLALARQQDLDLRPTDLPALIHGMYALVARSLAVSASIKIQFPARLPLVRADANQLELAVLNLTVNARDAMHGGPITISAQEASVESGDTISLPPGRYV